MWRTRVVDTIVAFVPSGSDDCLPVEAEATSMSVSCFSFFAARSISISITVVVMAQPMGILAP